MAAMDAAVDPARILQFFVIFARNAWKTLLTWEIRKQNVIMSPFQGGLFLQVTDDWNHKMKLKKKPAWLKLYNKRGKRQILGEFLSIVYGSQQNRVALAPMALQGGLARRYGMRMQKQGRQTSEPQAPCWTYHSCFLWTGRRQTNCGQNPNCC